MHAGQVDNRLAVVVTMAHDGLLFFHAECQELRYTLDNLYLDMTVYVMQDGARCERSIYSTVHHWKDTGREPCHYKLNVVAGQYLIAVFNNNNPFTRSCDFYLRVCTFAHSKIHPSHSMAHHFSTMADFECTSKRYHGQNDWTKLTACERTAWDKEAYPAMCDLDAVVSICEPFACSSNFIGSRNMSCVNGTGGWAEYKLSLNKEAAKYDSTGLAPFDNQRG